MIRLIYCSQVGIYPCLVHFLRFISTYSLGMCCVCCPYSQISYCGRYHAWIGGFSTPDFRPLFIKQVAVSVPPRCHYLCMMYEEGMVFAHMLTKSHCPASPALECVERNSKYLTLLKTPWDGGVKSYSLCRNWEYLCCIPDPSQQRIMDIEFSCQYLTL